MNWSALEWILAPIVWVMGSLFSVLVWLTESFGFSIFLLSALMMLVVYPIRKRAQQTETHFRERSRRVREELRELPAHLKGENLFLETEKIYNRNDYHPIQAIAQGASFFVILPILLSAIILFNENEMMQGQSFFIIHDLSEPDRLLGSLNLLPFLMCAISIIDARFRFRGDTPAQKQFFVLSFVMLVLVYGMPAALVLYWTGSNLMSFATAVMIRAKSALQL